MAENPFANVNRRFKVDKSFFIGEPVCDERRMMQEQKAHQDALAIEAYNAEVMEKQMAKNAEQDRWNALTKSNIMENTKMTYINKVANELPTYLLGEAFASVFTRALPHNKYYVLEHYGQFNQFAHMYINKLGGFPYLQKVAATTESTYLKKLTTLIQEATKKTVSKKTEELKNALTEDDVKNMINPMIDPKEKNDLLAKVDTLGSDELAELVNQKVLDVVNDERRKVKQDTEFKNLLKNDLDSDMKLDDSKASDSEELNDKEDIDSDDNSRNLYTKGKKIASGSGKKDSKSDKDDDKDTLKMSDTKEATMNMSFMEAFQKWDPVNGTFDYHPNNERRTLFTSMMENCMSGLILGNNAKKIRPSKAVYESAINLTALEDMIRGPEPTDDTVAENTTPDMDRQNVDKARILSEVLTQYTLLETAHTMRLIKVTPVEVARQCDFLTHEYA